MTRGLIPLLLPVSGESRSRSGSASSIHTSENHRLSLQPVASPHSFLASPSTPTNPNQHKRQFSLPTQRLARRPSFSMPSSLNTRQPQSSAEWRRAISEVKRKYVSRKYRACWTRCCELLDGLEQQQEQELEQVKEEETEQEQEEPQQKQSESSPLVVYRIYLHFYAASSFEMGARPLSTSSPFRGQLLRDARAHYDRAAALIEATEEAAAVTTIATQETGSRPRSGSATTTATALALLSNSAAAAVAAKASNSGNNSPSLAVAFSATFLQSPSLSSRCSSRASVVSSASSASAPSSPRTSLCSSLDGAEQLNKSASATGTGTAAAAAAASTALQNQTLGANEQQSAANNNDNSNNNVPKKLKKKKVSFSGLPDLVADTEPAAGNNRDSSESSDAHSPRKTLEDRDPCVRPDSPTLGCWEEDPLNSRQQQRRKQREQPQTSAFLSSPSPSSSPEPVKRRAVSQPTRSADTKRPAKPALSRLITTPPPAKTTTSSKVSIAPTTPTRSEESSNNDSATPSPRSPATPSSAMSASAFDLESFLQAKSVNRVCAQLSALRAQIHWHRDAVGAMLQVPDETPETPALRVAPATAAATCFPYTGTVAANSEIERESTGMPRPDSMAIPTLAPISIPKSDSLDLISNFPSVPPLPAMPKSACAVFPPCHRRRGSVVDEQDEESVAAAISSFSRASSRSRSSSSSGSGSEKAATTMAAADSSFTFLSLEEEQQEQQGRGRVPATEAEMESMMVARGSAPRPYSRTSCRSAESRLCSGQSTPTLTPSLTPTTLASPSPSSSSSYHSFPFPAQPAAETNVGIALSSSPAITTAATTPSTPSFSSYYSHPSSPVCKAGSSSSASHSHSCSYSQRPATSLSIGFGIGRPASAASTRSSSSLSNRDEGMQQRIERLRASGWQRKRFDKSRYEALREQVLGELGE